jgi:hypothetical protein
MTKLDAKRYRAISAYAGEWLLAAPFRKFSVDEAAELAPTGCAVYIVDDAFGDVDYVGSVCRVAEADGTLRRLSEHLRDPLKRQRWHRITVIALRRNTPLQIVRDIEAAIGADLLPKRNRRLPPLLRSNVDDD